MILLADDDSDDAVIVKLQADIEALIEEYQLLVTPSLSEDVPLDTDVDILSKHNNYSAK